MEIYNGLNLKIFITQKTRFSLRNFRTNTLWNYLLDIFLLLWCQLSVARYMLCVEHFKPKVSESTFFGISPLYTSTLQLWAKLATCLVNVESIQGHPMDLEETFRMVPELSVRMMKFPVRTSNFNDWVNTILFSIPKLRLNLFMAFRHLWLRRGFSVTLIPGRLNR